MADGPQLALSPTSATPGTPLTISGAGFVPNGTVSLYWNGNQVATLPVSAAGTFAYYNALSPMALLGSRSVVAQDTGGAQTSATFTVLPPAGGGVALPPPWVSRSLQVPIPSLPLAPPAAPVPVAPPVWTSSPPAPPPLSVGPAPAPGIPTAGTTSNGCQITPDQASAEQLVLTLLNQDRAAAGAPPLTLNETLSLASREHSCDMLEHQQLDHNGSDGSSPFQRMSAVGIAYSTAGENIGMTGGYVLAGGVATTDREMMAEPLSEGDHHWNIVNPAYTQVGLGVIYADNQVWLTEDFVG